MCIHPKKKKSYSALSRLQAFADAVLSDGMKRGRELVVGSISQEIVLDLQKRGIVLETTEVTIDDAVIVNTRAYSRGRALKVVIQPNFKTKGRTLNYLKSIGIVRTINMNEQQFRKIK